ncbi:hypothetical protein MNEG_10078, partial [Monoraphidium neglectum]
QAREPLLASDFFRQQQPGSRPPSRSGPPTPRPYGETAAFASAGGGFEGGGGGAGHSSEIAAADAPGAQEEEEAWFAGARSAPGSDAGA